jgi:hypothetical protein
MTDTASPADSAAIRLRLYVVGNAPNSAAAIRNLELVRERLDGERCEVEIVDLSQTPARARDDGILVTPALVCLSPRRALVLGNLSDTAAVLAALGR